MIRIKNIEKKYGNKKVLNDVSFDIEMGQICGLMGLNGAGKSTLMKIITTLVLSDKGDVFYDDVKINNTKSDINIGFMIESPSFYKDMTGKNNLVLLASLYDDISETDVIDALTKVGLYEHMNILYKKYSLGMKQRLYFAYAIMGKPKLLVLDEPFNGIDPITIRLFKNSIIELRNNGCIVLISSHVISDIEELCDKVVIIDKGNIIYDEINNKSVDLEKLFISKVDNGGMAQ